MDATKVELGQPAPRTQGSRLRVNVLLPDGYDGQRRFPVLYLLHGANGSPDDWLRRPHSAYDLAADLRRIAAGFEGIIVMPEGGADGWYANWWNGGRRRDPAWERFHLDELVPLVERRLRVRPGRRFHAVAGWSMGGYGALSYASQRPGYFGLAASLSGPISIIRHPLLSPLPLGDPVRQRFYWAGHDPPRLVRNLRWTRVYVRVGDGVPRTPEERQTGLGVQGELSNKRRGRHFVGAARRINVSVSFRIRPGIHNGANMRRGLGELLRWSGKRFGLSLQEHPRRWTYKTVARVSDAFGFTFTLRRAPNRLITLTRRGTQLTGRGSGRLNLRTPGGARRTAVLPFRMRLR